MVEFERELKVFAKSCEWNFAKIKLFKSTESKAGAATACVHLNYAGPAFCSRLHLANLKELFYFAPAKNLRGALLNP